MFEGAIASFVERNEFDDAKAGLVQEVTKFTRCEYMEKDVGYSSILKEFVTPFPVLQ